MDARLSRRKESKKEKFGPMVGLLVTSLSILVLIAILFPWYVIMTLLVALARAIVRLLKIKSVKVLNSNTFTLFIVNLLLRIELCQNQNSSLHPH